jgi:uncharacterized protein
MTYTPLAVRIVELADVLRRAGVAVGSGEVLLASGAAELVGVERPADLREALATTLLHRHEDRGLFDQAFQAVIQAPPVADRPSVPIPGPRPASVRNRRLATALTAARLSEVEAGAAATAQLLAASDLERLSHRDFEQMSADEARAARELLREAARWWRRSVRRWLPSVREGTLDPRRSLRALARRPDAVLVQWRERRERPARLLLLCDVSGSMRAYSRAFLQLAHALAGRDRSLELFAFATRLTRLTPLLRTPDPDLALARIGAAVQDWDSGTRIGSSLAQLLRSHRRTALDSNTLVVLLSDGLERGEPHQLRAACMQLRQACRAILWLNPLLRYADYAPLARGAAVLTECFQGALPAHDPASLATLVRSVSELARRGNPERRSPRALCGRSYKPILSFSVQ